MPKGDEHMPKFSPDAPPKDWECQHDSCFTRMGILRFAAMTPENRPVPRQANCHYYADDPDPRNFYFY